MEDMDICEKIVGPNIHTLEVNTVRTKPKVVVND